MREDMMSSVARVVPRFTAAIAMAAAIACGAPAYHPPDVIVPPAYRALDSTASTAARAGDVRTASAGDASAERGTPVGVDSAAPRRARSSTGATVQTVANDSASLGADSSLDADSLVASLSSFTRGDRSAARARLGATRSTVSAEPLQSPFWNELGDTALIHLIGEGLRANPDLHVAEARVRDARAAHRLATFDLVPTITAAGGFARQRLAAAQLPGVPSEFRDQSLWDAGFDASWELDVFGRVRRTVGAQDAFTGSTEQDARFVRVTLAAELARTYFQLRGAQSQLAVAQRNAENQRRTLALTEQRLSAGKGTAFDTERARAQLSTTLAAIPTIESEIASDQYQIATLLGRAPDSLPEEVTHAADLPPLPPVVHVGSPALLVKRRPDVLSAERVLAAQTMLVGAAKAEYLPRFTVGGSVGLTATALDSLGRSGASRFLIGPTVSWPLLDLGRVKARVDESRALEEQAEANYSATVLRALQEAESSLVTYDRARSRLGSLADAASASERAAALARLRYESGVSDFLQVLDAERTMLEAENQLARGRTDAATALVAVYKAVGGTWPSDADASH